MPATVENFSIAALKETLAPEQVLEPSSEAYSKAGKYYRRMKPGNEFIEGTSNCAELDS